MKNDDLKNHKNKIRETPIVIANYDSTEGIFSVLGTPKPIEPTIMAQLEDAVDDLLEEVGYESFINLIRLNCIFIGTTKTNGEPYYMPLMASMKILDDRAREGEYPFHAKSETFIRDFLQDIEADAKSDLI